MIKTSKGKMVSQLTVGDKGIQDEASLPKKSGKKKRRLPNEPPATPPSEKEETK